MERRQIRRRWQITIPRDIRQRLNLFEGQLLNWDLIEDSAEGFTYIRIYSGQYAQKQDQIACQEVAARKERKRRQQRCGRKSRKSDRIKELQAQSERWRNPVRWDATELQEVLSSLSQFLLSQQGKLSKLLEELSG